VRPRRFLYLQNQFDDFLRDVARQELRIDEQDFEVHPGFPGICTICQKEIRTGWNHRENMFPVFLDHRNVIRPKNTMKNILDFSQNFDFSKSKFLFW